MNKYIYLFEDDVKFYSEPPNKDDLQSINDGYLRVICVKDNKLFDMKADGSVDLITDEPKPIYSAE